MFSESDFSTICASFNKLSPFWIQCLAYFAIFWVENHIFCCLFRGQYLSIGVQFIVNCFRTPITDTEILGGCLSLLAVFASFSMIFTIPHLRDFYQSLWGNSKFSGINCVVFFYPLYSMHFALKPRALNNYFFNFSNMTRAIRNFL